VINIGKTPLRSFSSSPDSSPDSSDSTFEDLEVADMSKNPQKLCCDVPGTETWNSILSSTNSMAFTGTQSMRSTSTNVVTEQLEDAKRHGRRRQMSIRGPPLLFGLPSAVASSVVILTAGESGAAIVPWVLGGLSMCVSVLGLSAGLLPSDRRAVPLVISCANVPILILCASYAVKALRAMKAGSCARYEVGLPCPYVMGVNIFKCICMLLLAMYLVSAVWRFGKKDSRRVLLMAQRSMSVCWFFFALIALADCSFVSKGGFSSLTVWHLVVVLAYSMTSFLMSQQRFYRLLQSWLMSRGGAAAAAASVASMLGNKRADEVLTLARENFRTVPCDRIRKEDLLDNRPNSDLAKCAKRARLGHCDAFLSHSWSDSPEQKWKMLQAWRRSFKKAHNGREPTLWIDKYCLNQQDIHDSLACLPVYLAGCSKLLILCGASYLTRLWCIVEIFTFLAMGGELEDLEVHILQSDSEHDRTMTADAFRRFDIHEAKCVSDADTQHLLGVIDVAGHDEIKELVLGVFVPRASKRDSLVS